MVGKLKAALDARRDPATIIIARTDAVAVEGLDARSTRRALPRGGCRHAVRRGATNADELAASAGASAGACP